MTAKNWRGAEVHPFVPPDVLDALDDASAQVTERTGVKTKRTGMAEAVLKFWAHGGVRQLQAEVKSLRAENDRLRRERLHL